MFKVVWRMVPYLLLVVTGLLLYQFNTELGRLTLSNDHMVAIAVEQEKQLARMFTDPACRKLAVGGSGGNLAAAPLLEGSFLDDSSTRHENARRPRLPQVGEHAGAHSPHHHPLIYLIGVAGASPTP